MNTATLFSSARSDWATPRWLFTALDAEFGFTLDAAAREDNALCGRYYTAEVDALTQAWRGVVWCNPPYSRRVGQWVEKGFMEAYGGHAAVVVMLVAARTDTRWWADYAMEGAEIRFIRGRLHFGGSPNPAPFPSAVLVFDRRQPHPVAVRTMSPPKGAR